MNIELSSRLEDIEGLGGYAALQLFVRLHGKPVGYVTLVPRGTRCAARDIIKAIFNKHSSTIIRYLLCNRLAQGPLRPGGFCEDDFLQSSPPSFQGPYPLVTAAVCTRDRTDDLSLCLDALTNLSYPKLDLLVVDNAPTNDSTRELVRRQYPEVRYVREPRPGLNWARNRAILEAQGEIIAFTDDDVLADREWINALARIFIENPQVMAVTGLVTPYQLETKAQVLFEMYGGFGRGFKRKWYHSGNKRVDKNSFHLGAGIFGTGANMAFRRCLFEEIGGFDPALDVGTVTNGGGDLEMFFRVLQEGHTLVYEPEAVVQHRHRRKYENLKLQLTNHGIGLYAYFVRSALAYPAARLPFIQFGLWWLLKGHIRPLLISFIMPNRYPRELMLAEFKGSFIGLYRYYKARRMVAKIIQSFGQQKQMPACPNRRAKSIEASGAISVRSIDLNQPLSPLTGVENCAKVRIFVTLADRLLGKVEVPTFGQTINVPRLREAIVEGLTVKLLESGQILDEDTAIAKTKAATLRHDTLSREIPAKLSDNVSVSVVVATLDRPKDLQDCLRCLIAQQSSRQVEIIVVDNNPDSGLTSVVVDQFPGLMLINEHRRGLAYARNAGFAASTGDIVIATDDDVIMPPTWLEKLLAPFERNDVMAVTGNVLPLEMETAAQQLFERYGGLGRGFERIEANRDWFEKFKSTAVPTWTLGATANAAFRAFIFSDSQIGLMDEALGPGMPSGVGEDTYLFYKILKAGYTILYEPDAYVWHKHRRDLRKLRSQLYNYSKGHVAYHLTTLLRDGDLRPFFYFFSRLPKFHLNRLINYFLTRSNYPLQLIISEILGNLAGPFALWKSRRRVKREGHSKTYISVAERQFKSKDSLLVESLECLRD